MSKNNISDELIIETSAKLSNKVGLDNLSLKMVAEELNIKSPSLYNHISSLDEIKMRLMIYGWKEIEEKMLDSAVGVAGYEALKNMCYAFYDYAINNKGVFTAILWYNKYESIEKETATTKLFNMLFKIMKTLNISDDNINHTIRTLRSFLEGFSLLVNNNAFDNPISIKESFDLSLEIIINGIKSLEGVSKMNEYVNLTLENIDEEHICCAIGDKKHQAGVDSKKEWIKNKLKDDHVFRKLNARGKIFIEYEPIETAWVPISGKNYEYIYCLWVAGSFKGKGIAKELLEYAINDSKEKGMSGICTLTSKKKKPFIGEKKFFEYYGFKVVDTIGDYELLALCFCDSETPRFNNSARLMKIDNQEFTIYYSNECPYVEYEVKELTEYSKDNNIKINFIKIDSLEKAKNAPCIFNNWANFYKGEFVSNTILNANSFEKLIKE